MKIALTRQLQSGVGPLPNGHDWDFVLLFYVLDERVEIASARLLDGGIHGFFRVIGVARGRIDGG